MKKECGPMPDKTILVVDDDIQINDLLDEVLTE